MLYYVFRYFLMCVGLLDEANGVQHMRMVLCMVAEYDTALWDQMVGREFAAACGALPFVIGHSLRCDTVFITRHVRYVSLRQINHGNR